MLSAADPIILCGGAGTRLRSVTGEAPKSLACIGQRPFLEILLSQLHRHGFYRAILAVGYQNDLIRSHFGDQALGLQISYSVESTPLGTGGALRNALAMVESQAALIMNGDSYTDVDLGAFLVDFQDTNADLSVVVVPADGREDCGSVAVDPGGRVLGFREKQSLAGKIYVNAGIYLARKRILEEIPTDTQVSLEAELFPRWLRERRNLRAFHYAGECIDIGTPQRFQSAQVLLANAELGSAERQGKRA
jgi:NDP-sugar pyrophosphorylase family protein